MEELLLRFAKQMRDEGAHIFNDKTLRLYVQQFLYDLPDKEDLYACGDLLRGGLKGRINEVEEMPEFAPGRVLTPRYVEGGISKDKLDIKWFANAVAVGELEVGDEVCHHGDEVWYEVSRIMDGYIWIKDEDGQIVGWKHGIPFYWRKKR